MSTQQTALTQYVDAPNGTRYAYRRFGNKNGEVPLVMHSYYRANMDFWDPALINPLAAEREVIIFDQPGIGRTPGVIPTTFQGWGDDLIIFVKALGLKKFDLFGFSMGGIAVQMVALTAPDLIRRLVLAGTTASAPSADHVPGIVWPREEAPPEPMMALTNSFGTEQEENSVAFSFFNDDEEGQAEAKAYWERVKTRKAEPLNLRLLDPESTKRQLAAAIDMNTKNPNNSFDRLGELKMPVMIANGDNDNLIPPTRSWELYRLIYNAHLVMYPRTGHGFLWQYANLFAQHINTFLDSHNFDPESPKS